MSKSSHHASRRQFLAGGAGAAALVAGAPAMARDYRGFRGRFIPRISTRPISPRWPEGPRGPHRPVGNHPVFGENSVRRAANVFSEKLTAARRYLTSRVPVQETNNDEALYADYRASFSKTLPHNEFGEVDVSAYKSLLTALRSGQSADFDRIILDQSVRTRRLANPQAAGAMPTHGPDGQACRMKAAPSFTSLDTAGEMLELYWKANLRDVPFTHFGQSGDVSRALSDINAFPIRVGAGRGGRHQMNTLFRGETPGDRVGPYLSQFLWRDVPYGNSTIAQQYDDPARGGDFMTNVGDWLTVQRGGVVGQVNKGSARYIYNGRSLAEYVHVDHPYQAYLNAALILLGMGSDVLDQNNPVFSTQTQGTFVTHGGADVLAMVGAVSKHALHAAWYQKWLAHRRLRPEAYGGRLHFQHRGQRDYDLSPLLTQTEGVGRTLSRQGNTLLSQCYPEGSPTHPAYPAGHACIAGACTTVLKAFFNEDFVMQNSVRADATGHRLVPISDRLTVGGELNKLANNAALGRNWGGVHYRSDGVEGIAVGEEVAIQYLKDQSETYAEHFDGFRLTRFDGTRLVIRNGSVR